MYGEYWYEEMMEDFPEIESVKDDEKKHGDTLTALLENGEYNDVPKFPVICALIIAFMFIRLFKSK